MKEALKRIIINRMTRTCADEIFIHKLKGGNLKKQTQFVRAGYCVLRIAERRLPNKANFIVLRSACRVLRIGVCETKPI
jgi:hypothetical protein